MKKLLMTTAMTLALIAPAAHVLAQTTTDTDPLKKLLTSGSASSETGVTGDSIGDDGVGHDDGTEGAEGPGHDGGNEGAGHDAGGEGAGHDAGGEAGGDND